MPKKSAGSRRSAFGEWAQSFRTSTPPVSNKQSASPGWGPEDGTTVSTSTQTPKVFPSAPSIMDLMGVAKPKERSRQWEREHRGHAYRGVPEEIREQVVALAEGEDLTVDEVAQAFMEYGFACIDKGKLTPPPSRPKARHMTIYPLPSGWGERAGWSEKDEWSPIPRLIPPRKNSRTRKKSSAAEIEQSSWKNVISYRLSNASHEAIKELAQQSKVPLGEIVTLFLKHGLEMYKAGRFEFNPQPKQSAK